MSVWQLEIEFSVVAPRNSKIIEYLMWLDLKKTKTNHQHHQQNPTLFKPRSIESAILQIRPGTTEDLCCLQWQVRHYDSIRLHFQNCICDWLQQWKQGWSPYENGSRVGLWSILNTDTGLPRVLFSISECLETEGSFTASVHQGCPFWWPLLIFPPVMSVCSVQKHSVPGFPSFVHTCPHSTQAVSFPQAQKGYELTLLEAVSQGCQGDQQFHCPVKRAHLQSSVSH